MRRHFPQKDSFMQKMTIKNVSIVSWRIHLKDFKNTNGQQRSYIKTFMQASSGEFSADVQSFYNERPGAMTNYYLNNVSWSIE